MADLIGKTLGGYRLESILGKGGLATVYRAYQASMKRYVAVKVIGTDSAHDPGFVARFSSNARVVASLNHPHILPVLDFGEAEGVCYLVTRYLEAGTLEDRMRQKPLMINEVARFIEQIASALDYAHHRGVIHQNFKASNVLLDNENNTYLTDFVANRLASSAGKLTATGSVSGSPAYMSPEQVLGRPVDGRSDIYALGVLTYEMVTNRLPFVADTNIALVFKQVHEQPTPPRVLNPELPEALEAVILRSLAKDPDQRYQHASEMAQIFSDFAYHSAGKTLAGDWAAAMDDASMLAAPPKSTINGPIGGKDSESVALNRLENATPEPEFRSSDQVSAAPPMEEVLDGWLEPPIESADSAVLPPLILAPAPNPRPVVPPAGIVAPKPAPVVQRETTVVPPGLLQIPPQAGSPIPKTSSGLPTAATAPGTGRRDKQKDPFGASGGAADKKDQPVRDASLRKQVDHAAMAPSPSTPTEDKAEAASEAPVAMPENAVAGMPAVEDAHFTAFRPETVPVGQWLTLLVYAHADRALDLINADAEKFADQMGGKPKAVQGKAAVQLARGTELRIVPTCDAVQFNPESITIRWIEDWHRAAFRFQAESALSGTEDVARVAIYVGPLLVGQIKLAMSFINAPPPSAPNIMRVFTGRGKSKPSHTLKPASAKMYEARQIFLSYSHADTNVVLACRDACKRLGFTPLIDIDTLRAGQHWNDELMNMIERADIFQLFWSERAAQSKYVQQEWEYALKLVQSQHKGPDFIRPTYWEKPPAPIPEPLADIHFDYTPVVS